MSLRLLPLLLLGCAAAPSAAPGSGSASLALGQEARLGGVRVRALRVVEDSRCPTSVQCVHAGTVRLAVRLREGRSARDAVLRLDEPQRLAGGSWILLQAVCPHPRVPGTIPSAAYRFRLAVDRGSPPPPLDFACPRGG